MSSTWYERLRTNKIGSRRLYACYVLLNHSLFNLHHWLEIRSTNEHREDKTTIIFRTSSIRSRSWNSQFFSLGDLQLFSENREVSFVGERCRSVLNTFMNFKKIDWEKINIGYAWYRFSWEKYYLQVTIVLISLGNSAVFFVRWMSSMNKTSDEQKSVCLM